MGGQNARQERRQTREQTGGRGIGCRDGTVHRHWGARPLAGGRNHGLRGPRRKWRVPPRGTGEATAWCAIPSWLQWGLSCEASGGDTIGVRIWLDLYLYRERRRSC